MHLVSGAPSTPLSGTIDVPRSKYHAHRALILASLAPGESRIAGACDARHVEFTIRMLRGLGTRIDVEDDAFVVHGGPYVPQRAELSVGSSGTTLYFMVGLASLAATPVTVTGQKYFQRRPIGPLLDALRALGVRLDAAEDRPPVHVRPSRPTGGHVRISGTLSQWISGLVLLAPFASGPTVIEVEGELNERPYVELTVAMMRQFGLEVDVAPDWRRYAIAGDQEAQATDVALPPDIGSAAFGLAAAALHPADVLFRGLTRLHGDASDHPEVEFLAVAQRMGVPLEPDPAAGGVRVRHDGVRLRGTDVDCRDMPDMLPVLAAMGALAEGRTTFRDIAHVRLKESDRVAAMLQLDRMGAAIELDEDADLLVVDGVEALHGAPLSSYNDHRVLMALAVAASRAADESTLTFPNAYRISYPGFLDDLGGIGLPLAIRRPAARPRPGGGPPAPARASVAIDHAAQTPLPGQLARWARERPNELALVDVTERAGDRAWTWSKLARQVDRTAQLLLDLGVGPGEPVAYQLPNRGEFVVLSLAIMRIGAICAPLMPIFREREIAFALGRSRARVLFVADAFRGRDHLEETRAVLEQVEGAAVDPAPQIAHVVVLPFEDDRPALPPDGTGGARWHRSLDLFRAARADVAALDARAPAPDAPCQLLFTSGTTGEPKGVVHRFDALTRAAAMEIEHLGLGRRDRIFIPSPLAHQTGFLYGMWLAIFLGAPQIVQDRWDAPRALDALGDWGGTFVQAATPFLDDLVREVEAGAPPPASLRIFVATGAAVPRTLAERATAVLQTAVCGAWGSTETCLGTLASPDDPPEKTWGTDGRALAGVELRIVDDEGRPLGPGQEGNFELHSACFFTGYLDRDDLTAAALAPDGWYRTGDLATLDADGYLRISGRVKDVINRGGEKVPVAEVEEVLHRHPAVADVAIVAMPDPRLGERACAFVVLEDGAELDFEQMQRHLDALKVAKPYWPERLETLDALPRNPVGKVQKFLLRERASTLRAHRDKEQVP